MEKAANNEKSVIIKVIGASAHIVGENKKITGTISGKAIIPVIDALDLEANPRASKTNSVTDAICESLEYTPQLFPFKTKGILMGYSNYEELARSRYKLYIDNPKLEGVLDGGHNMLAIGLFTLGKAYEHSGKKLPKIKIWKEFKEVWENSCDIIEDYVKYLKENPEVTDLDYEIPIEIVVPRDPKDIECVTSFINSLFEICYARNNNAQLADSDKANHKGYFEELRNFMKDKYPELADRVSWKSNEGGDVKAQDIVALSLVPLNIITKFKDDEGNPILDESGKPVPQINDEYGKAIEPIAPQKLYSAKGSSLQHFERIMGSDNVYVVDDSDSKHKLLNETVSSALKITADMPELYDYIYEKFPELYNKAGGSYGRIGAVKSLNGKNTEKYTPFLRRSVATASPDGFIFPLVYGLQTLMEKATVDGQTIIRWSQPPLPFLEANLGKIVSQYIFVVNMCGFDPQKVGKNAQVYQMALTFYRNALNGTV